MGNTNYSKFSQHFNKNEEQHNEVIEGQITIDELITAGQATVDELITGESTTEVNHEVENVAETVSGVVSGCEKLNMREDSNKESKIITVLTKDAEVKVNLTESTEDFYKVCTASGLEGYCMKKFIVVK